MRIKLDGSGITMNKVALLLCVLAFVSCSSDTEDLLGNWVEDSDFEGFPRSNAVAFVIDEFGYVGTGFNGTEDEYYNDFWRYDSNLSFWQQIAPLPGIERTGAVAFSIDGFGYAGLGYDGENELQDFYRYDPQSNQWTEIAQFAGSARRNAVAFAIGGKGYVGTGNDGNTLKDFWEYDPDTDSWAQIPSLGGGKRENAAAFVLGETRAFVGTGTDNGFNELDFWEFDPALLPGFPWVRKKDLDDDDTYTIARGNAVAFASNNMGYVATGTTSTVWEYNFQNDEWEQKTNFEGSIRRDAVSFVISGKIFVTTGRNGSTYFDDMWVFEPGEDFDEND